MKSTLASILVAIAVGIAAGSAVGYWEARPWAAGNSPPTADAHPAHDHAHDHDHPGEDSEQATAATPSEADAPVAVAPDPIFRFGNMESGATQNHTYPITNTGKAPLTVNYVTHTCKCTEVRINDQPVEPGFNFTVPPGGKAEVMLQWAAKVPPGPFRHGASFTTNDPNLSRLEYTVEGQIVSSTTLEPSRLDFGSVHVATPGKAEMVVMAFLEPKVEILSHEVLDAKLAEHMTIAIEPLRFDQLPNPQAKAGVRITATYDAGGELGPFGGSLRLETNLKQAPRLEVPISGTVKGDVWIFGPGWSEPTGVLRMAPVASAQGGSARLFVNVRGADAAATEVSLQSVEPKELKVTVGERQKLRDDLVRIPLTVEIPPGVRAMTRMGEDLGGEGEIVLATTHPKTSSIRLRVFFTVQP